MKAEIISQLTWEDISEIDEAITEFLLSLPHGKIKITPKGYRQVLKRLKEKAK